LVLIGFVALDARFIPQLKAPVDSQEKSIQEDRHRRSLAAHYLRKEDLPAAPKRLNEPAADYDDHAVPRIRFKSSAVVN
jgi:hypothetical protein